MSVETRSPESLIIGINQEGMLVISGGFKPTRNGLSEGAVMINIRAGSWSKKFVACSEWIPESTQDAGAYPRLLWATVTTTPPGLRYRSYEVEFSFGNNLYRGERKAGFRDRDVIAWTLLRMLPARLKNNTAKLISRIVILRFKPVLAIHCWHEELVEEFLTQVIHPSCWSGLTLLIPENLPNGAEWKIVEKSKKYGFREIKVRRVPSKGRDVGGFITLLTDLAEELNSGGNVPPHLFLHTKRSSHLPESVSRLWRGRLFRPLLSPKGIAVSLLGMFAFNRALAFSRSTHRIEKVESSTGFPGLSAKAASELGMKLFGLAPLSFSFCAGTMMWFSPKKVIQCWDFRRLSEVMWMLEPSSDLKEPSHAHAFERLFPEIVQKSKGAALLIS